ncbi:MAG: bifunctional oligoribonuclease/PAP phosphatase NrnA [Clostridia bacterium]|nr:bifunctional oligoribonuclease/PAP phosphatase NrnA [Clostridia bacterium]
MSKIRFFNEQTLSALKKAGNVLLCTHVNPDGDAVGSMLAAARLLRRMGKETVCICQDPVPYTMMWLDGADSVLAPEQVTGQNFDTALALDLPDTKRMGTAAELFETVPVRIRIDHHPSAEVFSDYEAVDRTASSTGELITALWEEMGYELDVPAAEQLYTAISTDTGNFCFNNVRPYTFACMEKLMAAGLDISAAARRMFLCKPRAYAEVLGYALNSLRYFAGGRATCMHVTAEEKEKAQATDADLHGIVNFGLQLEGVQMTFMADEAPEGWRISLRALPGADVSKIARQFGGGGHMLAAGCRMQGTYAEIEEKLIMAFEKAIGG